MTTMDKVVMLVSAVVIVVTLIVSSISYSPQKNSCADIEIRPDATEHQKDLCRRSR